MLLFWLGFMTCLWLLTVAIVGYVCYRYVYCPWTVMRNDIKNLAGLVDSFKQRLKQVEDSTTRKSQLMTDEEVSAVEKKLLLKSRVRGG